jgi:hypothetical protein
MTQTKAVVTKENKTIEDIYLAAGVLGKLFLDKVPVDLFRFVAASALPDRMAFYPVLEPFPLENGQMRSSDLDRRQIEGTWYVFPKRRTGLSTFGGPVKFKNPGQFYRIPKGTCIPGGLAIGEDNMHPVFKCIHYSIMPRFVMAEMHYLFLLRRLASFAVPYQA